jgi:hypothetical protein
MIESFRQRRRVFRRPAHQLAQQPVGEVVEIAHPLAQIGIGHVLHARAHVALHLFDRRFRGQAVADRLIQAAHPALVVGEHAVGFEHGAVLAFERHFAARQHVVDRQPQRSERLFEPLRFLVAILVEQVGDDDARLVQHDMAKPDAVIERQAVNADGRVRSSSRPGGSAASGRRMAIISAITMAVVSSASISSSR